MSAVSAINVNLQPCTCRPKVAMPHGESTPQDDCHGEPILVPCPLPRTWTVEVVLGKFSCHMLRRDTQWHDTDCPARPVRVACSISGETWAESEPTKYECREELPVGWHTISGRVVYTCRDRWALVKALVLGLDCSAFRAHHSPIPWASVEPLVTDRNAMFSELASLVLAEQAAWACQERAVKLLGDPEYLPANYMRAEALSRPSADLLAQYVHQLMAKIGGQQ